MAKIAFKKLTNTDRFKLTIPQKSYKSFPQPPEGHHAKDFDLRDESGVPWPVSVRTRRGKYKKPILSGGWSKLVLAKYLGVGDEVSFFKQVDQATGRDQYMIRVETPINHTISVDALVHGTEEATGKATYMIEEKSPITKLEVTKDDAPVHGIDVKRETMMFGIIADRTPVHGTGEAVDKATYRVEEKGATKLFGVTINDKKTPTSISEVTVDGPPFYKWL